MPPLASLDAHAVGTPVPSLTVTPGHSDIVAMSLATRDFHPVHHDLEVARAAGHPALFINIMTTTGLVERFVRSWAGPRARIVKLRLKLGVPHYAGEALLIQGHIANVEVDQAGNWLEVEFSGTNARGRHASGIVRVTPATGR